MPKDCVSRYECESRIKWSSCSITWTINDLSKLIFNYSDEHPLLSKSFSNDANHVWQLKLSMARPRNVEIDCKAFLISDNIRYATINCSISFLDNEKKELKTEKTGHFSRKCIVEEYEFFKTFLRKDQLTIYCEINVAIEQTELVCSSPVWDESYLHRSVNQNIEKFQGSQFLTDVDLEVSGKTFKGHKLILAAVSPVFEKMFRGNSQEHQNNRVVIEDINADVFEELMTYIYSGQLPHLKEMSSELLEVADRYCILSLLQICMNDLVENLSVDDAAAT